MNIYLIFILLIFFTVGLNTIPQQYLGKRWNGYVRYAVPASIMILFLGTFSRPLRHELFSDFFKGYYRAGRLIIQNPSSLYNSDLYNNMFGFVNIPIVAFLFAPFSLIDKLTAIVLFSFLGLLSVIASCYLLLKITRISGWQRIVMLGLFAINGPLYHSLRYANLTHFVLLLLVVAWFCLTKQREVWVGILLAIACLIKIPLFLLGVYFALRKRWRVLAGFCLALLGIVGTSLLFLGFDLHLAWLQHIEQFSGRPISAYNVQSLDSFLVRLLPKTNGELTNWQPIEVGWEFKVIRYALLSLLVGATFWVCWRSKKPSSLEEENLEFSIVLCLALVISPIAWTHYYLLLLLPLSLYLGNQLAVMNGRIWSTLLAVSTLLISLPVITPELPNSIFKFVYSRLLVSHYFFGGVLLLGVLLATRWQSAKRARLPHSYL